MSTGIHSIPAEVLLKITRYLTIQSIRRLKLTSRYLNEVISGNEWTVYHNAALTHAYVVDEKLSLSEAKIQNSRYPIGDPECATWAEYCRQCFVLDTKWAGIAKVDERNDKTKGYCTESCDVHHFKVDEQRGLLFTSGRGEESRSAITVTSLKTGKIVWQTQPGYIKKKPNLEYDNGYVVFDAKTVDREKEVWRLADEMEDQTKSTMPPDPHQMRASQDASASYGTSGHGILRPWAFMPTPEIAHVLRLVYPTLVAASRNTAYVWDITTGKLEQTLQNLQTAREGAEPLGDIHCVDVNTRHIVLCGENEVQVIARAGGALVCRMSGKTGYAKTVLFPEVPPPYRRQEYVETPLTKRLDVITVSSESTGDNDPWKRFQAAHLSACGHDLACLLQDGRVILVRDYEAVAEQRIAIEDAALEISFTHSAEQRVGYRLAFEHGRVAVVTSVGLFVVTLDAGTHRLLDREPPPPVNTGKGKGKAHATELPAQNAADVVITYLLRLSDRQLMADISCAEITATHVYFVYKASRVELWRYRAAGAAAFLWDGEPRYLDEIKHVGKRHHTREWVSLPTNAGNSICCIDFSA